MNLLLVEVVDGFDQVAFVHSVVSAVSNLSIHVCQVRIARFRLFSVVSVSNWP